MLLAIVLALMALLAASGMLVRRPAARAWLASTIAREASKALGLEVRVGDAWLHLVPLRIDLRSVAVGPPNHEMATVAILDVDASVPALLRGEVALQHLIADGVRVAYTIPEREQPASGSWARVVIRRLELRRVTIAHLGLPSGLDLKADNAEASWSADAAGIVRAAVVRVGGFAVKAPGVPEVSGTLAARGRRAGQGWEVAHLRASGHGWDIKGKGASDAQGTIEARARVTAELATLDALLAVGADLEGEVRADIELTSGENGVRCSAAVSSQSVAAAGFAVTDLVGRIEASRDRLDAEILHATFAGGSVTGTYALAPLAAPWRHRVALRTAGTDLDAFMRTIHVEPAGLAARIETVADLAWQGADIGSGLGTSSLTMTPGPGDVPIGGELGISLAGDHRLAFHTSSATLAGAPLEWDGTLTLGDWVPDWRFRGEHLTRGMIARLLRGWVGDEVLPSGLDAELDAEITLQGPFDDLTLGVRVAATPLCLGAIAVDRGDAAFTLRGGVMTVERAGVGVGAGRLEATGTLQLADGALAAEVTGEALPFAHLLAMAGAELQVDGVLSLSGTVRGTLASPRAALRLDAAGIAVAGFPLGEGRAALTVADSALDLADVTIGPISGHAHLDLTAATAVVDATVEGLDVTPLSGTLAALAGGPLRGTIQASFPLAAPAGTATLTSEAGMTAVASLDERGLHASVERPGMLRASAELASGKGGLAGEVQGEVLSLRALAAALTGDEMPVGGTTAARARVTSGAGGNVTLDGEIERASIELEGEQMDLDGPTPFKIAGGTLLLERAVLAGPRSRLELACSLDARGALSVSVDGEVPAALLAVVWPEGKPRGTVTASLAITGSPSDPRLTGTAGIRDGAIVLPGVPGDITDIAGTVALVGSELRIDDLHFQLAGGEARCSGRVLLDPELELDILVRAGGVPWKLLPRFSPILAGDVRVSGRLDRLLISGELTVEDASFREQINLNTLVLDKVFARERVAEESGNPITLNVGILIPGTLDINTLPLRLQGRGKLRLVGTTQRLGLIGRVDALPGGEFELSNQRYEIDRATVTFTQPDRIDPAFDILARAWVDNVEVTVSAVGTLDRFTPTFSSNPPMSQTDIIGLLSSGKRGDEGDPKSVSAAASTFINGQLASAVSTRARSLLNVDQLRLDPASTTSTGESTTRMTVAQQLTRNWTVSVSSNLSSNREQVVHSVWRVGQGLLIEAMRNGDGSYSAGFKWQRRY